MCGYDDLVSVRGEASWVLFLLVFERVGTCQRSILRILRIVRCGCFPTGWLLIVRVHSGKRLRRLLRSWGVANESLRRWYEQHLMNTNEHRGMTRAEHEEVKRLKREVAELRRANEILKTASVFFAAKLDRPARR